MWQSASREVASRAGALELAMAMEAESCPVAVADQFQRYIEAAGYSSAVCLLMDRTRSITADDVLMSTRPARWCEDYVTQGHMAADPILAASSRNVRPFSWSEVIDAGALGPAARMVMSAAAEHGMDDGFVVPICDTRQQIGLVSLAGPRRQLTRAESAALTMVSVYVHQRLVALRRERSSAGIELTQRELEIVRWIAAGKSDWQIGQILAISAKTVNYHVENVKRKFGVASRIQAVVAALNQGGLSH